MKPRHGTKRRREDMETRRSRVSRIILCLALALALAPSLIKAQHLVAPVELISASPRLPVSASPAVVRFKLKKRI